MYSRFSTAWIADCAIRELQVRVLRRTRTCSACRRATVETEYARAVTDAEVRWLTSVIDDLKSGRLSWTQEQLAAQAAETFYQAAGPAL